MAEPTTLPTPRIDGPVKKPCSIDRCKNPMLSRGWCGTHYRRWSEYGDPNFTKTVKGVGDTAQIRFWDRVTLTADDQRCWEWRGARLRHEHGRLKFQGKYLLAHRLAWFFVKGEMPKKDLLHSCPNGDNPACVNPNHLREGTHQENMQDMVDRGRTAAAKRTHCLNGHDIRVEGAIRVTKHARLCIQCDRNRKRRWEEKNRPC